MFGFQERRQKRIIYAALGGSLLASLVWLIATCTPGWVELILPQPGVYLPSLQGDDTHGRTVLVEKMWNGLWTLCRVECSNDTSRADTTSPTVTESLQKSRGILETYT